TMDLPMPVFVGSWMGGDRDGNPYVNDAVTERTLELHRWIILDRYADDLEALVDPLAAVAYRLPPHPELEDALARASAAVPEVVMEAERRNPDEPLRRLLTYVRERIARTRAQSAGAYPTPDAFLDDLLVVRDVLREAHAESLPDDSLLDLVLRVRCFGFHLAALDVREDARVHRQVVAELLGDPSYPDRSDADRRRALRGLELPGRGNRPSQQARRLLELFDSLGRLQARFGAEAVGTYVISMTEAAADVMEVHRLASLHGIEHSLDIVPLLETRSALENAADLMSGLLQDETYREHVLKRGDVQELLVGYSDSMKESGILASRVLVADAQSAAARVCRDHGVTLRVFHGRGGSVSRGGGPTYRAIRALPRDAFTGRMKITEQGETRAFHFGNPDLATRYLEQTLGAAFAKRCEARSVPNGEREMPRPLLAALARDSHAAYRELVEDDGLIRYFRQTTPLSQISGLNIASRPSKRGREAPGLEDLRAIPWVFAWSQSRHVVTGWYGVGAALERALEQASDPSELSRLYDDSPFFFDLLDNVQMVLAKSDMPIAERYASLCTDEAVRERIFGLVQSEYARTTDVVLRVTGQKALLDEDPVLQRSIRLRNPYVDPLSYLQVEALGRLGAAEDHAEREPWERVARVAVQGIAAGLRNTG
ncbi:MAG: phosphoenolpyruvate carboxylase, partial [Polyangiales bacterium]